MPYFSPSHEADVLRAASMYGELPMEVGEGFFAPLIQDIGWPFRSIQDSLHGTDWHRILYPFTLEQFAQLRWCRRSFLLNKDLLHPVSQDDINLVIRNLHEDIGALVGRDSEPSRRSFAYHRSRVLHTHDFCAPVTLAVTVNGIKILDGNHRVAALLNSGLAHTVQLDAWIGFNAVKA